MPPSLARNERELWEKYNNKIFSEDWLFHRGDTFVNLVWCLPVFLHWKKFEKDDNKFFSEDSESPMHMILLSVGYFIFMFSNVSTVHFKCTCDILGIYQVIIY